MKEVWKDIPTYEGMYQVSDQERVKSSARVVPHKRYGTKKVKERILKQSPNSRGYLKVDLYMDGKAKTYRVHQLVAMAFLGHKPGEDGIDIDHDNNKKTDNRPSNLILRTHRENSSKDQWRHNRSSKYVGVSWWKREKKWVAQIYINGKRKYLGYFDIEIEAHNAYQDALKNIKKDAENCS